MRIRVRQNRIRITICTMYDTMDDGMCMYRIVGCNWIPGFEGLQAGGREGEEGGEERGRREGVQVQMHMQMRMRMWRQMQMQVAGLGRYQVSCV